MLPIRHVVGSLVSFAACLALSCSSGGSSKVPDACIVKSNGAAVTCTSDTMCGMNGQCDTAMTPSTCVLSACLPEDAPCTKGTQCKSGKCGAAGDGGICLSGDAGGPPPNPCMDKPNYVFPDAPDTFPNGFTLEACGAYVAVEGMVETDNARAPQFITPLAGQKLPSMPPYKFSWSMAMFPPLDIDGGTSDDGGTGQTGQSTIGTGYVVYFIDGATSKELLRVHTVQQEYTPDDPSWAKIVAAMGPNPSLQLKIYAASFAGNIITPGTAPVTNSQPRFVQIMP
jgi:hypothetical protein